MKFNDMLLEDAVIKSKDLMNSAYKSLKGLNGPQNKMTYHLDTKGSRYVVLQAKLGKVIVGELFFQDLGYSGDSLSFSGASGIFEVDVFYDIATKIIKTELGK